ncbi:MAG: DUF5057 domain-containing protein [Pseudomonadota bacterium]|nr:DUF5057 domain-containing protein [Pseudomonadota bacterium]
MESKAIKYGLMLISFLLVVGANLPSFAQTPLKMETVVTNSETSKTPVTTFAPTTEKIYLNWQAQGLRVGQKIKAVWIADDTHGAAPNNYKVVESSVDVGKELKDSGMVGTFSASKPTAGWPVGDYHVEIYVDSNLANNTKFSIVK